MKLNVEQSGILCNRLTLRLAAYWLQVNRIEVVCRCSMLLGNSVSPCLRIRSLALLRKVAKCSRVSKHENEIGLKAPNIHLERPTTALAYFQPSDQGRIVSGTAVLEFVARRPYIVCWTVPWRRRPSTGTAKSRSLEGRERTGRSVRIGSVGVFSACSIVQVSLKLRSQKCRFEASVSRCAFRFRAKNSVHWPTIVTIRSWSSVRASISKLLECKSIDFANWFDKHWKTWNICSHRHTKYKKSTKITFTVLWFQRMCFLQTAINKPELTNGQMIPVLPANCVLPLVRCTNSSPMIYLAFMEEEAMIKIHGTVADCSRLN